MSPKIREIQEQLREAQRRAAMKRYEDLSVEDTEESS